MISGFLVGINAQDFQDCALIVTNPATTSSNPFRPFRGQLEEKRTCITYRAVDSAFTAAQSKLGFNQSQGRMRANVNKVGELGTVIHETSRILERRYGLSTDAVAKGLPLIDTTRTLISQHCPAFLMTPRCHLQG